MSSAKGMTVKRGGLPRESRASSSIVVAAQVALILVLSQVTQHASASAPMMVDALSATSTVGMLV